MFNCIKSLEIMNGCLFISVFFILFLIFKLDVDAACTGLPADLQQSSWVDDIASNTLTFGTKTLTGFSFQDTGTTLNAFTCVGNVDNVYVFGSDSSVSSPDGSSQFYYLCMRITKVSENSYYYYLLADENASTFPRVRAVKRNFPQNVATGVEPCDFCNDVNSGASILRRSTVAVVPPVTADPPCLPCTTLQAVCDLAAVVPAPAVTTMATTGSSQTTSVLPLATNSQSSEQRLPDVSGVAGNSGVAGVSGIAGNSESGSSFVNAILLLAAIVGIQAIIFNSVESVYEVVQFDDTTR
ncbi:uncharacterized protein LOC134722458 [Mytilus trossulus]|uniref:uncharacterized protein LOC134722458 n=1 Tax=Mytilus trossulus TaxID=6551 RepID=UPI0030061EFC